MNNEQQEYVQSELASGVSPEKIRSDLLGAGYTDEQVTELLQAVAGGLAPISSAQDVVKPGMSTGIKILLVIILGLVLIILMLGGLVLGSLNNAQDGALDAYDKITLNSLRIQAELFYTESESYFGFCNSASIEEAQVKVTSIDCADSEELYRVSTQLSDGVYFCIDSIGYFGDVSTSPMGLSCG